MRENPVIFPAIVEEDGGLGKIATMRTRRYTSYADIPAATWNRLAGSDQPCLRHEYLHALEASGSAAPATGWTPLPIVIEDDSGCALGAVPLWRKSHSFGELVYDFAWAQAYERAGLAYYPKLIAAIPFTPVAGTRLLLAPDAPRAAVTAALLASARELADETRASSLHWLFTDSADTSMLERHGYLHRTAVQFHWENRGYRDFDDFLAGFSADKRKKLRRERRHVRDAGVVMEIYSGRELAAEHWDLFYDFYTANILRHGGMIHLTREFFHRLGSALPEAVVLVLARRRTETVGAAINLRGRDALYGRYWGGQPDIHSLHFETCYYAAIEYCIAHGLRRFEGGAGGEHKLARGFLPVTTHSAHWLRHPQFAQAVADFLAREQHGVAHYLDELNEHAPFKPVVSTP
jgi:predicted N-acyltransferase